MDNVLSIMSRLGVKAEEDMISLDRNSEFAAANDKLSRSDDTSSMTEMTRSELNATLSAIEERMDKRIERMERSEDRRNDAYRREQEARDVLYAERFEATNRRLEDRDKIIDSKLDAMNASIRDMSTKVDGFKEHLDSKVDEVKSSNRNTGWAVLGIVISVGVATVLGLWGANSTIVGSASSIFESGKQQSARDSDLQIFIQESKAKTAETQALLEQIKQQQSSQVKPAAIGTP